ncbi:Protein of unknown function [Quadrisphaera granulorum]|uniref:Uncharacterized protein DUF2867 n=1 Tax=Quadrisphaera granulorum TaxID=317664 RepID=A0A315ZSB1_9ACTN|nr:DUF2867 domain-containing protein [Quadrisphaera granulorum]PWJ48179.1 uncharacterized protein DUF2867 [Quadrisphaera granulorum]SZE98548.1 Protein of unknown function [Quadrisphaera granulorum]
MTAFASMALRDIPRPDFADCLLVPLANDEPLDARTWAGELFSFTAMPGWVRGAMQIRQLLAPFIGVRRANRGVFAVREGDADEALIAADETHLLFRYAVAIHREQRLLSVTTTVRLLGWRGRLYFLPVRVVHPLAMQALVKWGPAQPATSPRGGRLSLSFDPLRRRVRAHRPAYQRAERRLGDCLTPAGAQDPGASLAAFARAPTCASQ